MIKAVRDFIRNRISHRDVYYLVEGANWSIDHDGRSITTNLHDIGSMVTTTSHGVRNSIVHFGSINTFMANGRLRLPHKSNKIVVTWFHVIPGDKRIELIPEAIKYVDLWHTSCILTKSRLIKFGVLQEKITVIPLGVNLNAFSMPTRQQRENIRLKFGIPKEKVVVGSFQKDGNGWGEGLEPKLIKGPDVFCDVIEKLRQHYDLFVLLTGPARGYVKQRLERAGIPYLHRFLNDPDEVAEYYKALDIYIVTGREEGGPKAVVESLASGVPLVSTKVGMALDIIQEGKNGFLCEIEDVDEIVDKSISIIENVTSTTKMIENGLEMVQQFSWRNIARKYQKDLYLTLL